jgi:hypothetical protein
MNGNKGDHPLTDILVHNLRVFSEVADSLIKEICDLGGEKEIEKQINLFQPPTIDKLEKQLKNIRDELKKNAKERGWEVD